MFAFLQFVRVVCVWSDSSVRVVLARVSVGLYSIYLKTTGGFFCCLHLFYVGGRTVQDMMFPCLERLMRQCRCTSDVR